MKCCSGNGWYTSWSGGFAHPAPCKWCNPQGLPASAIEARSGETTQIGSTEGESAVPNGETPK